MPTQLAQDCEPLPGYRLVKLIGQGGFGQVWEAEAPGGMHVALKFIRTDTKHAAPELRAIRAIRDVRHPHLLEMHFAQQVEDMLVIASSLCDKSLIDRYKEYKDVGELGIPVNELLGYMQETAVALDFLNEPRHRDEDGNKVSIQHRDIKPHNILLMGGSVKVADFGLAKVLRDNVASNTGGMTPHYAAPELFRKSISRTTDQYSLGITYYQLRTGQLAFTGSVEEIVFAHIAAEPNLEALPPAERAIVARALAKDPEERWNTCRGFVEKLIQAATPRSDRQETMLSNSGPSQRFDTVHEEVALDTQSEPKSRHTKPWIGNVSRDDVGVESPSVEPEEPWRPRKKTVALFGLSCTVVFALAYVVTDFYRSLSGPPEPAILILEVEPENSQVTASSDDVEVKIQKSKRVLTLSRPDRVQNVEVVASLEGYHSRVLTWSPLPGKEQNQKVTLEPEPALLTLSLEPAAADLSISPDVVKRSGDKSTRQLTVDQPDQTQRVTVIASMEGYQSESYEWNPRPGQNARFTFRLARTTPDIPYQTNVPKSKESRTDARQFTNSIGMRFALIPPGEFVMGSPAEENGRSEDEIQQKQVIREAFYLGQCEVTVGEFRDFVEATGYITDAERLDDIGASGYDPKTGKIGAGPNYSWRNVGFQEDNHPVVNVTWHDANKFCEWLSKKEDREYRLPMEAEWEYACRGGTHTAYWVGSDPELLADADNIADAAASMMLKIPSIRGDDGFVFTAPVGKYRANPFGLYDVHGNVREWCADRHEETSGRVMRGGAWNSAPENCRSAARSWGESMHCAYFLGFRVATQANDD